MDIRLKDVSGGGEQGSREVAETLGAESRNHVDHEEIYRAHKARIMALCRLLLGDRDEAEDVAQEVFLRAFQRLRSQGPPMIWEAWLVRVAVNACRDRQRSGWWRRRVMRGEIEAAAIAVPSSEAEALGRERQARVWQRLGRLGARQRNVFVLRYVEGWSTIEVANALGLSTGSVKRHLFRAVRHLRRALER